MDMLNVEAKWEVSEEEKDGKKIKRDVCDIVMFYRDEIPMEYVQKAHFKILESLSMGVRSIKLIKMEGK